MGLTDPLDHGIYKKSHRTKASMGFSGIHGTTNFNLSMECLLIFLKIPICALIRKKDHYMSQYFNRDANLNWIVTQIAMSTNGQGFARIESYHKQREAECPYWRWLVCKNTLKTTPIRTQITKKIKSTLYFIQWDNSAEIKKPAGDKIASLGCRAFRNPQNLNRAGMRHPTKSGSAPVCADAACMPIRGGVGGGGRGVQ